jgi:hypothetical protein
MGTGAAFPLHAIFANTRDGDIRQDLSGKTTRLSDIPGRNARMMAARRGA